MPLISRIPFGADPATAGEKRLLPILAAHPLYAPGVGLVGAEERRKPFHALERLRRARKGAVRDAIVLLPGDFDAVDEEFPERDGLGSLLEEALELRQVCRVHRGELDGVAVAWGPAQPFLGRIETLSRELASGRGRRRSRDLAGCRLRSRGGRRRSHERGGCRVLRD